MESRKKQIKFLIFILICVLLYSTWTVYGKPELSNDDFIRFHVIANSNSKEDQQLKLKVKDEILAKINSELVLETMAQDLADYQASNADLTQGMNEKGDKTQVSLDLEQSRNYIQENIIEIEEKAEEIIKENGYDYTVKAELGVKWIPEKRYGDVVFPAGNYEALNITIGEGKGENWWCVLFPPLCLIGAEENIDEKTTQNTYTEDQIRMVKETYQDAMLDKKYKPLLEERDNPVTLKLKFKTLEIIGE
ncbi:MAG: stage II sporulation protein R [Eubacteriales bacterium]|nr:stage II sporulation protein R [Eubacteriales bacterium]